jgi:DHA1 family multidrug resistance protein-like MFS transporter
MNESNVDRYIENSERDASPERFGPLRHSEKEEIHEPIARTPTASSSSSSSSNASDIERDAMSRVPTQRDNIVDLERHETALSRIHTQRTQHSGTVGASLKSRASKKPLPAFGAGKPYPPALPERESYVVEFDGPDDPLHAQNWPLKKKLTTAAMLGFTTLTAAFGSSIISAATGTQKFNVSSVIATLATSLYVLGYECRLYVACEANIRSVLQPDQSCGLLCLNSRAGACR